MTYIRENPEGNAYLVTEGLTGPNSGRRTEPAAYATFQVPWSLRRLERPDTSGQASGLTVERVGNVVLELHLRPTSVRDTFEDRDGFRYALWPCETTEILRRLMDGRVKLVDGFYVGVFTFKEKNSKVKLICA